MNLYDKLPHWLVGNPVARATECVKDAAMKHCRVEAEIGYHRMMYNFYNHQAMMLNPNEQWWEFATAKEGARNHKQELDIMIQISESTKAKLDASHERLRMVREGS